MAYWSPQNDFTRRDNVKINKENEKFDTWIEASDWRYSASIVGLEKYLRYYGEKGIDYDVTDEYLKFHSTDITQEKYLRFAEHYYKDNFWHKKLENLMYLEGCSQDQIKMGNDCLKPKTMKKFFKGIKFDGKNQNEILCLIEENRSDLIRNTFLIKPNMYKNYANTGQLFQEGKKCCRLWGYYVDSVRKSKSISYNFDDKTFVSQDDILFDFIPFAFTGDRETFFINDNYSVKQLIDTNSQYKNFLEKEIEQSEGKSRDGRKVLFKSIQNSADFLDYNVEVIVKKREDEFFQTMYIRKESIDILKKLKVYDPFCTSLKINDNYYIDVQKEVMECILNLVRIDELIKICLKQNLENLECLVFRFIEVNRLICGGGEKMRKSMKATQDCAKKVAKKLTENKRKSYREKLTSAIVFKDYDRYCHILLQLSNYSDVSFDFAFDLFENFEENKDIAYTFINALTKEDE